MPNWDLSSASRPPISNSIKGTEGTSKNVSSSQTTMGTNRNSWPYADSSETINIYNPWHVPRPRLFLCLLNHSGISLKEKKREEEWPCHWSILTLSQLLTCTSSPLYEISSWLIFLTPPQSISCDSSSSSFAQLTYLYFLQMSLFCVSSLTSTFIHALWSPVDPLPFPLSLSICSHLFLGCKPAGESNGQALRAVRRKFHKSGFLEGVLVSPLSLLAHLQPPVSCFRSSASSSPVVSAPLLPPLFTPKRERWQPRLIFQATLWSLSPLLWPL